MEKAVLFLCFFSIFAVTAENSPDVVATETNEKDENENSQSNLNDTLEQSENVSPDLSRFISSLAQEIRKNHGNFQRVKDFLKVNSPVSESLMWTTEFDRALTSALYNNSIQNVPVTLNFIMTLGRKTTGVRMLDELRYQMSENGHLDTAEQVSLAKVIYFYSHLHPFQSPSNETGLNTVEEMELEWLVKVMPESLKKLVWNQTVLIENRAFTNYQLRVELNGKNSKSPSQSSFDIKPFVSLSLKNMSNLNLKYKSILYPGANGIVQTMKKVQKMDQRFWEISPVEAGQFFVFRDRKNGRVLNVQGENQCKLTDKICTGLKTSNDSEIVNFSTQWKIVGEEDSVKIMDK